MKIEIIALVLASVALACSLIILVTVFFGSTTDKTTQADIFETWLIAIGQTVEDLNATTFNYVSGYFKIASNATVSAATFLSIAAGKIHDCEIIRYGNTFYLTVDRYLTEGTSEYVLAIYTP